MKVSDARVSAYMRSLLREAATLLRLSDYHMLPDEIETFLDKGHMDKKRFDEVVRKEAG